MNNTTAAEISSDNGNMMLGELISIAGEINTFISGGELEKKDSELISRFDRIKIFADKVIMALYFRDYFRKNGSYPPQDRFMENMKNALDYVTRHSEFRFLKQLVRKVQSDIFLVADNDFELTNLVHSVHYGLFRIRQVMKTVFDSSVLDGFGSFSWIKDPVTAVFYEQIAGFIDEVPLSEKVSSRTLYRIIKIRNFVVCDSVYREVTFEAVSDRTGAKSGRITAFTKLEPAGYYTCGMELVTRNVMIGGKVMPVNIITAWKVSVTKKAFADLLSLLAGPANLDRMKKNDRDLSIAERKYINAYLTKTGTNLVDIILDNVIFAKFAGGFSGKSIFMDCFRLAESLLRNTSCGHNVCRYLLFKMDHDIFKKVLLKTADGYSGSLNVYAYVGCSTFDDSPFTASLPRHNPRTSDLLECIPLTNHLHELMAYTVTRYTENTGHLFMPLRTLYSCFDSGHLAEASGSYDERKVLEKFSEITEEKKKMIVEHLAKKFNDRLYPTHVESRKICVCGDYVYVNGYVADTQNIMRELGNFRDRKSSRYAKVTEDRISGSGIQIDSEDKRRIITGMFSDSGVAAVYGPAGTGKSTLIQHLAELFKDQRILFLTQTHAALDNLKRRVPSCGHFVFRTVKSFLSKREINFLSGKFSFTIMDECSTIGNRDMNACLEKLRDLTERLLLVGDTYQIKSIQYGNWFGLLPGLLGADVVYELQRPYRTANTGLLTLWNKVRNMDDDLERYIDECGISSEFDESVFEKKSDDEVTLCLNYDGLYGINSINRFLQKDNPNREYLWKECVYKVGDPVVFLPNNRFEPVLYNNLKGVISKIDIHEDVEQSYISFEIELDKRLDGEPVCQGLNVFSETRNGHSVVSFKVYRYGNDGTDYGDSDEEDDTDMSIVPFQVAYALSFHKSQGLEYDSVKLVIADENEDVIDHNIFYTAVTRTRNRLRIYWSDRIKHSLLKTIRHHENTDAELLKQYRNRTGCFAS
jgi:hypothetical protein